MSRIYFHSQAKTVEILGCERAMFGAFANNLLATAMEESLKDTFARPSPLRQLLPPRCYLLDIPITETSRMLESPFENAAKTWLRVSCDNLNWDGTEIEVFALALNTMLVVGSDVVKLGARLHGQCEIHAYIEQDDRPWIAGIIEKGRTQGFLRPDMGWGELVEFLRDCDGNGGPIVTSYSVTRSFPNYELLCNFPSKEEEQNEWGALSDAWYSLPSEKQWADAMPVLRAKSGLQITPANWDEFTLVHGINGYQLNAILQGQQKATLSPLTVTIRARDNGLGFA